MWVVAGGWVVLEHPGVFDEVAEKAARGGQTSLAGRSSGGLSQEPGNVGSVNRVDPLRADRLLQLNEIEAVGFDGVARALALLQLSTVPGAREF